MNEYERSPAEIERQIEVTRERMSRDIGELGERLSPERLKRQARGAITGTARRNGFRMMDFIQENPSLVTAMGLGAVWRMSRFAHTGPERRGPRLLAPETERESTLRNAAQTITQQVKESAGRVTEEAKEAARESSTGREPTA